MKFISILLASANLLFFSNATAEEKTPASLPQNPSSSEILEPGDAAPDFSLKGSDGKTYSLKDVKGKIIVLEWFNNECPFVNKHYSTPKQNMQKLQEMYTGKGVVWYTISSTKPKHSLTPEGANAIIKEKNSHQTALLLDSDGSVARTYRAKTTPHIFIIGTDGKIVYNGAIDDTPDVQKESIEKAHNYVSEALDILLSPKSPKTIKNAVTKPYGCSVKI